MQTQTSRPWYRWHWLTWLLLVAQASSLLSCQLNRQYVRGIGSEGEWEVYSEFGWPVRHRQECLQYEDDESAVGNASLPEATVDSDVNQRDWYPASVTNRWSPSLLAFNCLFSLLVLIATGVLVESRLRYRRRTQFTLAGVGIFTAMIAVVTSAAIHWKELNSTLIDHGIWVCGGYFCPGRISAWLLALPLLGTICLLYLGLSLIFVTSGRCLRCVFPSRIKSES